MAYYRTRHTPEVPGGMGLRIVMLITALASIIVMRAQCAGGVVTIFEQVAPPQSAPSSQPVIKE
jgi:hypothetical protein